MVKRRAVVILLSIMIISLFSGCSEQEIEQGLGDIGGHIQQVQDAHTETIESEQTTETDMPESEETLEELPSIYYAYHTLDKEGQKLYLEIYRSLQRMETDTAVSTLDIDELNTVFQYVLADHPELFYVEGYQYTQYTTGDVLTKLTFTGTYTMAWEDVQLTIQRIETVAEQMTAPLAQITDQYTIIRYLYDSLIIATEYQSVRVMPRQCSIYFRKKAYRHYLSKDRPMEKDMPGIWYWQMVRTIIWTRPGEMLLTAGQKRAQKMSGFLPLTMIIFL